MTELLVSIVIPVYNTKPYIAQCLNSLIAQTMNRFEIICVNDGSTDGSEKILHRYQEQYSFIRVISQENKGAGVARNVGLSSAKGKYVLFLDSDDYFDEHLLEKVCDKAEKNNCDIVLFDIYRFDNQTKEVFSPRLNLNQKVIPTLDVFSAEDIPKSIFNISLGVAWNKLYRRQFIEENNLRFQEIRNSNSVYFSFAAFLLAKSISIVNERLLYYRSNNPKSTVGRIGDSPLCFIDAWRALHKIVISGNNLNIRASFTIAFLTYSKRRLSEYKSQETGFEVFRYFRDTVIKEFGLEKEPGMDIPEDLSEWLADLKSMSEVDFYEKYRG